ncbi:hypothetical protein CcaCcLH18_11379 [Colletotrichum camelliae]|nr:hypothetical protein CcaCcLH18_11379 [Colletotrichum camelliae]
MHAQEAVRIDSEILQQYRDTAKLHEKALETRLRFAKEHLELVLEKKRNFEADMAQWIARECLMADAQDAQLEQAERDEQAKRTAAQEDDGNPGDLLPPLYVTAADVGVLLRSSQNVTPDTASINEKSSQDRPQSTATVEAASPPVLHIHASDKEKS